MALRQGHSRYAVRFQYHGGSFLGFSQQKQEDCILPDGTDLRGFTSVETRLVRALQSLTRKAAVGGRETFATDVRLQVSSRTDRGVHALGNSLHVDLPTGLLTPQQLQLGLQFHLARDAFYHTVAASEPGAPPRRKRLRNANLHQQAGDYARAGPGQDIRILNVAPAPHSGTNRPHEEGATVVAPDAEDWNARFSATERIYVYRILQFRHQSPAAPFEWDRSWQVHTNPSLWNLRAMQIAADALLGEHDFSSFRAKGCQQSTPVVNLKDISIQSQPYGLPQFSRLPTRRGSLHEHVAAGGGLLGLGAAAPIDCDAVLISIWVRADSFLYRMVRNLVGYLAHVGELHRQSTGLSAAEQKDIQQSARDLLHARDRSLAPSMAPAHGLFLAHVQHGDFDF